jgi:peptide/nickel transport system ATP-binding protein
MSTANGATPPKDDELVLDVQGLVVEFNVGRGRVAHAVSGIDLQVRRGETLGLVGESGCGKSTVGKAIVQLHRAKSGQVKFNGIDMQGLSGAELRAVRAKLQMIFQDPISSLNPRRKVADIVAEPLAVWKIGSSEERSARVRALLEQVGIDPDVAGGRRPHEFSGGQCQRISIARALALEPQLIICDEPVSALDVSVQAQVLNLLEDLKEQHNLTLVFISHDLAVVKNISDRVAVMYLGRIVETAPSEELYQRPAHPYTYGLLSAVPDPDPESSKSRRVEWVKGEPPSPLNPPSGCRFRTRCPRAQEVCADEIPLLLDISPGHQVACHFPLTDDDRFPPSSEATLVTSNPEDSTTQ